MISLTSADFGRHCRQLAVDILAALDQAGAACSVATSRREREACLIDIEYHLGCLLPAIVTNNPALFRNYVGWIKALFSRIGIPEADFRACLMAFRDALKHRPDLVDIDVVHAVLDVAEAHFATAVVMPPSFLSDGRHHGRLAHDYLAALLAFDRRLATCLITDAVANGVLVKDIYLDVFQPVMYEIGRLWQLGEISVAQEHYCTSVTQFTMSLLYPHIFSDNRTKERCLVATCASGEQHEIGMRMVADIFELEGWNTHFLGANVPKEGVIRMLADVHADVLAVSTTLAANLPKAADLIAAVRAEPGLAKVKIIVGGNVFQDGPDLWRSVKADGSASNALSAMALAEKLTSSRPSVR